MVRSKAQTHFRQYMRNKPTKWGFKYWVLADITGYTVDFNLYEGKAAQSSGKGAFQWYEVFFDNFYTSPTILNELLQHEIVSTVTLRTDRVGVPKEVTVMKKITEKKNVPWGTGYYFRKEGDSITYCMWHDTKTVVLASTAYAGHSESTVKRRVKDPVTSEVSKKDVPCPVMLVKYNTYMGGVDKSDQYISYHNVIRKTVKYWKTCFYHLLDIAVVNSYYIQLDTGRKQRETSFREWILRQPNSRNYLKKPPLDLIHSKFVMEVSCTLWVKRLVVYIVHFTIRYLSLKGNVPIVLYHQLCVKPWKKIATLNGIPLHLKNFEIFGMNMLKGDKNQMNKLQCHLLVNEDAQNEALINEDDGECIEQNDWINLLYYVNCMYTCSIIQFCNVNHEINNVLCYKILSWHLKFF